MAKSIFENDAGYVKAKVKRRAMLLVNVHGYRKALELAYDQIRQGGLDWHRQREMRMVAREIKAMIDEMGDLVDIADLTHKACEE